MLFVQQRSFLAFKASSCPAGGVLVRTGVGYETDSEVLWDLVVVPAPDLAVASIASPKTALAGCSTGSGSAATAAVAPSKGSLKKTTGSAADKKNRRETAP